MDRPTKIRILGFLFTIEYFDKSISDISEKMGWCDVTNQKISICDSYSPTRTAEILLHEIMHAIYDAMGIQIPEKYSEDIDEYLVTTFSKGLISVMYDNPYVFYWIQELLKST